MKIALGQMNIAWESWNENVRTAHALAAESAQRGATLLILPEMFNSGFSMNVESIAEPVDGRTATRLASVAAEHEIEIIAGLAIADTDGDRYNSALIFDIEGNIKGRFDKLHPFSHAREDQYYRPGHRQVVFDLQGAPASIFICYDLRFPEVFRSVAREALIVFVIASWPALRQEHWDSLLRARSIENQCFVVGVNRIGTDGNDIVYDGGSVVFDPQGETVARAGAQEELLVVDIEAGEALEVRSAFPFLTDKRF